MRWCDVDEQSPEASGGFVRQSAEHDMAHFAELPCGGGVEHGIAVAVNGGPPRAHPVDQSAAVGERQGSPPCAESTISGRVDAGNDPYGCQRTSASMAETSWGSSPVVSTDAP